MKRIALSFGIINKLSPHIAEVIIDDGIELDMKMVTQYHNALTKNFTAPIFLLVNKLNSYTYTFEAQINIGTLDSIQSMAVVTYNRVAETSTKGLVNMPREQDWHVQLFETREEALNWLELQQSVCLIDTDK